MDIEALMLKLGVALKKQHDDKSLLYLEQIEALGLSFDDLQSSMDVLCKEAHRLSVLYGFVQNNGWQIRNSLMINGLCAAIEYGAHKPL